jgi:3-hydroxyisobutyrate dehydrogenase-like beta-hydroxyacid dehydrogenase
MRRKTRKTVGLIGLGIIGSRVANGLRAAGFHTYVWNRSVKPVPNFLASPAEVAEVADIIQVFVSDAAALMEVLESMGPKLTADHVIICSATIGPEATLEAVKFVEDRGARLLDAPFTGSKLAAERSQLVYYVGGDDATFLRGRPLLEASSKAIIRAGGVGDAALLKVVTNQIAAVSIQALAEALAIVRKAGLPPEALSAALEQNACRSGTMDLKLPKMIAGDFEPHFSLKHMFKDVQLATRLASTLDLDTPTTAVTAGVLLCAMKRDWGELDFASIYKLYEDGVTGEETPALEITLPGTGQPDSGSGASAAAPPEGRLASADSEAAKEA